MDLVHFNGKQYNGVLVEDSWGKTYLCSTCTLTGYDLGEDCRIDAKHAVLFHWFLDDLVPRWNLRDIWCALYQHARPWDVQLNRYSPLELREKVQQIFLSGDINIWQLTDGWAVPPTGQSGATAPAQSEDSSNQYTVLPAARKTRQPSQQGSGVTVATTTVAQHESAPAKTASASKVSPDKAIRPDSLEDAVTILKNRRQHIAKQGYQPKYSDTELAELAQNGDIGNERFQVRFMEERYLNDRNTPDMALSGKMGTVIKTETGEGAKYWSTSFDQLEDTDTEPKLICNKLGLEYDPGKKYVLIVVDTKKSTPLTGVKSVPATFGKVAEFANTELPADFPKEFTDKVMTPEFQAAYALHYQAAVESGDLPDPWSRDTAAFGKYLQSTGMQQEERELFLTRMEMHDQIGNNQDYLGNGLTKDINPDSPNAFGAVETLNFERNIINLQELHDAGAIHIVKDLQPL